MSLQPLADQRTQECDKNDNNSTGVFPLMISLMMLLSPQQKGSLSLLLLHLTCGVGAQRPLSQFQSV